MNTRKAYRMLVVVLFFAFVSLISRSIIYLILSVAIATMIMFLLSSAKKSRNHQGANNNQTVVVHDQNVRLHKFLFVTTVIGALILGYGSLFFAETTFFHQLVTVPNQLYMAILIIIAGFSIVLISLYFIIREMLGVKVKNKSFSKTTIYCGNCGVKNNPAHSYCSSCGTELTK